VVLHGNKGRPAVRARHLLRLRHQLQLRGLE
jgi:hypothetical protein